MSRRKILILFPQEHISYSPTTLGIYDALSVENDVTIYCPKPGIYKAANDAQRQIKYFDLDTSRLQKLKALPAYLYHKFRAKLKPGSSPAALSIYQFTKYLAFRKALTATDLNPFDEIIAVDVLMLAAAQRFCKQAGFLSLEIDENERVFLESVPPGFIKYVVIQTPRRYQYLFGSVTHKIFLVQNAPIFTGEIEGMRMKKSIIFNGTATAWFGLYHSLRFIKSSADYTITFKGVVPPADKAQVLISYKEEIEAGRIVFNNDYMTSRDMLKFLHCFEVGVCFYDLSFPKMNSFNYQTAPSGKMFAYFASGVPVVGNRIPGLQPVEEFEAGILIDDFEPVTIKSAVDKINANYPYYAANAYKAAAHYSFDKSIQPLVSWLQIRNRNDAL